MLLPRSSRGKWCDINDGLIGAWSPPCHRGWKGWGWTTLSLIPQIKRKKTKTIHKTHTTSKHLKCCSRIWRICHFWFSCLKHPSNLELPLRDDTSLTFGNRSLFTRYKVSKKIFFKVFPHESHWDSRAVLIVPTQKRRGDGVVPSGHRHGRAEGLYCPEQPNIPSCCYILPPKKLCQSNALGYNVKVS